MTFVPTIALAGAGLFGAAALVCGLWRGASSADRALVWAAAWLATAALPAAGIVTPVWKLPVLPAAPAPASPTDLLSTEIDPGLDGSSSRQAGVLPGERTGPATISVATSGRSGTVADPRDAGPTLAMTLLLVWAAGALIVAMPLFVGTVRMAWLLRRSVAPDDAELLALHHACAARVGLRRTPRLRVSAALRLPVAWQLGRATVVIPPRFLEWSAARQEVVLLHELAHLRRQDARLQPLVAAVLALHWFDPLAWLAAARWRTEREQACDDVVLREGVRPSRYAADLVAIGVAGDNPGTLAVAPCFARRNALGHRVRAILDPDTGRRSPHWRTRVTVPATALALALALTGFRPVPAPQISEPPPPAPPTSARAENGVPLPASPAPAPTSAPAPAQAQPDLDELVQMRIHGVTPEFIAQIRPYLDAPPSVRELVTFRIHGVSPDFAREMVGLLGDLDGDDLVTLRIHGAAPDWVREMSELLDVELTRRQVVDMRIHGVGTQLVRDLQEDGYEGLTVEELVKMRIHGIDKILARRRGGSR